MGGVTSLREGHPPEQAQRGLPHGPVVPGSVAWRVNRESALLLGAGRALLMQVAHPLVAAGVAQHSDFTRRPMRRLARTLSLSLALSFGREEEVAVAARTINQAHARVRGAGYSALDPDLLLWVMATLIDSAVVTYEAVVAPLSDPEKEAYYRESLPVAGLLGLSRDRFPQGWPAFQAYVSTTLVEAARPDATGRRLAALVLRPPLRLVPPVAYAPLQLITTGLLPPALREEYGLPWPPRRRRRYERALQLVRRARRMAPEAIAVIAPARRAERRLRWQ